VLQVSQRWLQFWSHIHMRYIYYSFFLANHWQPLGGED
jgi:hypothetical protein